jgi:glucose-fructose oxidoreductase
MKIMKTNGRVLRPRKVRYAVVGLGHIAQTSVLPGFANARENSALVALVSDDPAKLRALSKTYRAPLTFSYKEYEACVLSGDVDAVYIALPNSQHKEFAVRAAAAGLHVLCEKPLALDETECQEIIRTCAEHRVRLMTAYRLHFERANLEAIRLLQAGTIGEPRIFNSVFSMQIQEGNIRLKKSLGGGPLYDIGIYCINAARYLFRSEPTEVFAYSANNGDRRFREVDEMTSAVLRFPGDRLATFSTSFGAADQAVYEIIGTRGILRVCGAYEHSEPMEMTITVEGRTQRRRYAGRDQFGPELVYFSNCILKNKDPEPSGLEGLLDVHIIRSLLQSARHGVSVRLQPLARRRRPSLRQHIFRPPARPRRQIHIQAPSR